ncbi:MAG: hypothetical protein ACSHX8_02205 [Opitutaceae bacterium]
MKVYTVTHARVSSTGHHGKSILWAKNEWFQDSGAVIIALGFALIAYEVKKERIWTARILFLLLFLIEFWWMPLSFEIFDYVLRNSV